jgi:hypothetical protein
MAEEQTIPDAETQPSQDTKKKVKIPQPRLTVSDYIQEELSVDAENVILDDNLEFGQIRSVDPRHVVELAAAMIQNPPDIIDLTTWMHPGTSFISNIDLVLIFYPFTGTRLHYVLNGQHRYCAADQVKQKAIKERMEPPPYTKIFRCKVIRSDVSKEIRELIAGSEQSKQAVVKAQFWKWRT